MKQHSNQASSIAATQGGYTLLELIVAMVVFSVTLTGLLPLVAILSRDLQPQIGQKGRSPARDWNKDSCATENHQRSTWYMTAFDDDGLWTPKLAPWTRKLGACAQLTATSSAKLALPTVPLASAVMLQDDCEPAAGGFSCNAAMAWVASGGYRGLGYHRVDVPTDDDLAAAATWTFTVPADGWYSVQATWPSDTGLTLANATFQVSVLPTRDPPLVIAARTWNQGDTNNVNKGIDDAYGVRWWPITSDTTNPYLPLLKNDTVTVTLNVPKAPPAGVVIADAVRIVQNTLKLKSVQRSLNGTNNNSDGADVTAKASATVNVPQ